MADGLLAPDSSKSAFLEFGHPAQQTSPGMSHGHYPVHGLHSSGHSQHDGSYSGASSYGRSLGYPYQSPVSNHAPNPYMPYQNNNTLGHTRLDDTGKSLSYTSPRGKSNRSTSWLPSSFYQVSPPPPFRDAMPRFERPLLWHYLCISKKMYFNRVL